MKWGSAGFVCFGVFTQARPAKKFAKSVPEIQLTSLGDKFAVQDFWQLNYTLIRFLSLLLNKL